MSYSPNAKSTVNETKLRTPEDFSPFSGMCAVCIDKCTGLCEAGRSATEGRELLYPSDPAHTQTASEKDYPVDFSHFNINGRCFGIFGGKSGELTYDKVDLSCEIGAGENKIKMTAPYVLAAVAKLNWEDYYSGAALAGVTAVIGESVPTKDTEAVFKNGKLVDSPLLKKMHQSFYKWDRGYGTLFIQANPDDDRLGLLEYALGTVGFESVEIKFGQAAKGIQGMGRVSSAEAALRLRELGYVVTPDPADKAVMDAYKKNHCKPFDKIDSLPEWEEEQLIKRVEALRAMGAKFVSLKTGPFRLADIARLMVMASKAKVDMVTVDCAGGGTGHSPIRMMNEWGYPPVYMQSFLYNLCKKMEEKQMFLPTMVIAGGFALEDQIFKGLTLGAPYINMVGMVRAPMAAAMAGKNVGDLVTAGTIPQNLKHKGTTVEEIFEGFSELRGIYGEDKAKEIPCGALGLYNYIMRINTGLQQLMSLCRKFDLKKLNRDDLVPLTKIASEISGIPFAMDQDMEEVDEILG